MSSPGAAEDVEKELDQLTRVDDTVASTSRSKKRKRHSTHASDELEIDVSLPEPPSKKTLRKAKKQKESKLANRTGQDVQTPTLNTDDATAPLNTSSTKDSATKSDGSSYGIWIGNIPFNVTKPMLRNFLTSSASLSSPENPLIPDDSITRIHMPAPANAAPASKSKLKPQNKGFAYVDFSTAPALATALSLSEMSLGGRNVLIKSAKDFKGRPEETSATAAAVAGMAMPRDDASKHEYAAGTDGKKSRLPTRRVFVGNLGFDVTKEDLEKHFGACGLVDHVFMATFEDTGKCKGFAWVGFEEIDAAVSAVKGWTYVDVQPGDREEQHEAGLDEDEEHESEDAEKHEANSADQSTTKKKIKPRKWFVNRLQGRQLRCEFAEDASTRYKKRFGKDRDNDTASRNILPQAQGEAVSKHENDGRPRAPKDRRGLGITPGAPTDANQRRGRTGKGNIIESANYRTGAITQGTGKKVTFD